MSKIILDPGIPPLQSAEFRTWLQIQHFDYNHGQMPLFTAEIRLIQWQAEQEPTDETTE